MLHIYCVNCKQGTGNNNNLTQGETNHERNETGTRNGKRATVVKMSNGFFEVWTKPKQSNKKNAAEQNPPRRSE
jgi:hypothetical protein